MVKIVSGLYRVSQPVTHIVFDIENSSYEHINVIRLPFNLRQDHPTVWINSGVSFSDNADTSDTCVMNISSFTR